MLAFVLASMMAAGNDPSPRHLASLDGHPALICREWGGASSRGEAIKICRTHEGWLAWDGCHSPTRYCTRQQRMALNSTFPGRATAFPMDDDSRMLCRKLSVTGTRVRSISTCLPQREWDRLWRDSADETRKLQEFSKRGNGPQ